MPSTVTSGTPVHAFASERPERHPRPHRRPPEDQRRQRDPGRRPDRRHAARRERQVEPDLRGRVVRPGDQRDPCAVRDPPGASGHPSVPGDHERGRVQASLRGPRQQSIRSGPRGEAERGRRMRRRGRLTSRRNSEPRQSSVGRTLFCQGWSTSCQRRGVGANGEGATLVAGEAGAAPRQGPADASAKQPERDGAGERSVARRIEVQVVAGVVGRREPPRVRWVADRPSKSSTASKRPPVRIQR